MFKKDFLVSISPSARHSDARSERLLLIAKSIVWKIMEFRNAVNNKRSGKVTIYLISWPYPIILAYMLTLHVLPSREFAISPRLARFYLHVHSENILCILLWMLANEPHRRNCRFHVAIQRPMQRCVFSQMFIRDFADAQIRISVTISRDEDIRY